MSGTAARLVDALGPDVDTEDRTVSRILDAARDLFALVGIRRTSIDDVARQARLSRNTVFRRLGSKDELIAAVLHRELRALIAEVDRVTSGGGSPKDRVAVAFSTTVTRIRANPMFRTAMTHWPDEVLAVTTLRAGPLMRIAVHYVADILRADQARGAIAAGVDVLGVAEVIVRTLQSMVLTPDVVHPTAGEDDLRAFASRQLGALLAAPPE